MIEYELKNWLRECMKDGSFKKSEAEYILKANSVPYVHMLEINEIAKQLFDDFIDTFDFEKVNIVEDACRTLIKELEKEEKIASELKIKEENAMYHKLIE